MLYAIALIEKDSKEYIRFVANTVYRPCKKWWEGDNHTMQFRLEGQDDLAEAEKQCGQVRPQGPTEDELRYGRKVLYIDVPATEFNTDTPDAEVVEADVSTKHARCIHCNDVLENLTGNECDTCKEER